MFSRRIFLSALGASALASPLPRVATAYPGRAVRIDAQGYVGDGFEKSPQGTLVPRAAFEAFAPRGRPNVISLTIGEVGNGADRFRQAVEDIALHDGLIATYPRLLLKVDSAADIWRAQTQSRIGLIYNLQDTTPLEGEVSRVETFKRLGVRVIQLTYNKRNLAGDGCLERANAGLSDFGREVVAAINAASLLLDLSHGGQRTIAEAIAASAQPVTISHSGCRDLVDFPRNVYDREMRSLANKGGVFGLYLMPFLRPSGQPTREDLLRHLDHALNVCGEDHVAIGTDGPLFGHVIDDDARLSQRQFYEERARRGIAAPGEAPDVFNMVEGYNDIDRFDRIATDLSSRGWRARQVDKLLGLNFLRLLREVWGVNR